MNIDDFDRPQLAEARREMIRELLMEAGAVTVSQLQARFGISPMTARRDLDELERRGGARRTHGGAVLPSIAAPEDSFTQRVAVAAEAKLRLADAAFELLEAARRCSWTPRRRRTSSPAGSRRAASRSACSRTAAR